MKPEPTIREKIGSLACEEELDGFTEGLAAQGKLNTLHKNLLAIRRLEIRQAKAKGKP